MKNSQIIALASWLSFLALLWLLALGLVEPQPLSYTISGIFFFTGLFSGMLSWNARQ